MRVHHSDQEAVRARHLPSRTRPASLSEIFRQTGGQESPGDLLGGTKYSNNDFSQLADSQAFVLFL